jgi:hypothetical protein
MARRKRRVLRIIGWIIAGFFSLILLLTLGFYLGRGWIMKRAVEYINDQQPGEVTMGQINLIPLVNFPDITLQLKQVDYYERDLHPDSLYLEPILSLNEILVRLDVVELIRGNVEVSQAKIEKGFIRYIVYSDSVSNFERALGMRFGAEDTTEETVPLRLRVNLDRLELVDILALMEDHSRDDRFELQINRWENSFSYLPEEIRTRLQLDMDIISFKYLTYSAKNERNILFESEVLVDQVRQKIYIEPSSLKISGLEMETWGNYQYGETPHVDMIFRASNEGLEVLNYIFKGVLDLDEIEQIGSGKIYLSGHVAGDLGNQLPVVRLNGTADRIGFRIKPVRKDVSDITFQFYATNGNKPDMSEALLQVEGFSATFPEGTVRGQFSAVNLVSPRVSGQLRGDLELKGLDQMFQEIPLNGLEGHVTFEGNMEGVVDREREEFLNDSSYLSATLNEVGFLFLRDSLHTDLIKGLRGDILVRQENIDSGEMELEINGNRVRLEAHIAQLLPYLMGFDREIGADLRFSSDRIDPVSLLGDSLPSGIPGDPLEKLRFRVAASIPAVDLRNYLEFDSVPRIRISLDSFGVLFPPMAEIGDLSTTLSIGPDTISVEQLKITIGTSHIDFKGRVTEYGPLMKHDTGEMVHLEYQLLSDTLLLSDLFTFNERFLLPEQFQAETLQNIRLSGDVELPSESLAADSILPDFSLNIADLELRVKSYPFPLERFLAKIRKTGDSVIIDDLQGKIGNSNLRMQAMVGNFTDTVLSHLYGYLNLESELLDLNELTAIPFPGKGTDGTLADTAVEEEGPLLLSQMEYPDFELTMNIGELRYGEYDLVGIGGTLKTSREKVFTFDQLHTAMKEGGSIQFTGQFIVADPDAYLLSSSFDVKDIDLNALNFEMQMDDETYSLKENFRGMVSANGMAEFMLTPDFSVDIPTATAIFNVKVDNGELINFTPLQAAAKYLDNKDLNHVKFATLQNSFPLTLVDSKVVIPLTIVESTIGQMLIEGEQGLGSNYLYLLRLPTWLVKGAARSRLSAAGDDQEEDEIQEYRRGKFMNITVWGEGEESEVKAGDRRDKYR